MAVELELYCSSCGATDVCGNPQMVARLRSAGHFRRDAKPDPSLVIELFRRTAPQFSCHVCDRAGLVAREAMVTDWGDARTCQRCQGKIPQERIEVFPDALRCATCEANELTEGDVEYCGRCGNILQTRLTRRAGVSRYVQACPACGER